MSTNRYTVAISVTSNDTSDEATELQAGWILNLFEQADWDESFTDVEAEIRRVTAVKAPVKKRQDGMTKGDAIRNAIVKAVEDDAWVSRSEIALAAGATVGRVAEIVRDMREAEEGSTDFEAITAYDEMTVALREARKAERTVKVVKADDDDDDEGGKKTRAPRAKTLKGRDAYKAAQEIIDEGKSLPSDELLAEANAWAKLNKRRIIHIEKLEAVSA